jgi:hypothetical protein
MSRGLSGYNGGEWKLLIGFALLVLSISFVIYSLICIIKKRGKRG